ncbi:MAG: DUF6640 family protein [Alphaproteobacteria bacterium]
MASARWITLVVAAFIVVVPNLMDWGPTHIFNDDWTGHARLHTAWQLSMQTIFAIVAFVFAWRGKVSEAAVINLVILVSFFIAGLLNAAGVFEGAYTDMTDGSTQIGGIDGNLLAFSILLFLQVLAIGRARQANA